MVKIARPDVKSQAKLLGPRVPVFVLRSQRRGGMLGWLELFGEGTSGGTLRWMRPADSRQPDFPEGFDVAMLVSGMRAE